MLTELGGVQKLVDILAAVSSRPGQSWLNPHTEAVVSEVRD